MMPVQTAGERRTRETFLALMWALSYPGRPQALSTDGDALEDVAAALLDAEVSVFSGDATTAQRLVKTGARRRTIDAADFVFFDGMTKEQVNDLAALKVGDLEYPDAGATLVVRCESEIPAVMLRLSGPGVDGAIELQMCGLPLEFWAMRERVIRYPLGIDIFLIRRGQVIGLPRTTKVETCM